MISKKLSFTNGWSIEKERYGELVKELASEIILTIEEEWNRRRTLSNSKGSPSENSFNKD